MKQKKEKFYKAKQKFVRALDTYGQLGRGIWVQALPCHCLLLNLQKDYLGKYFDGKL